MNVLMRREPCVGFGFLLGAAPGDTNSALLRIGRRERCDKSIAATWNRLNIRGLPASSEIAARICVTQKLMPLSKSKTFCRPKDNAEFLPGSRSARVARQVT